MRQCCALLIGLLLGATMASAQDTTPPGGEQLGSDRFLTRGDLGQQPVNSPDANQQMTQSEGSATGVHGAPGLSGEGAAARTNQSPDTAGEAGQNGATAARRAEAGRDVTGGAAAGGGAVWSANTQRASNIVAKLGQQQGSSAAQQGSTRGQGGSGLTPAPSQQQPSKQTPR